MSKIKFTYKDFREYAILTLGLIIYTLGWTCFLIPHEITGGGASGIGALIYYVTGFPVGYTFLLVNAILITIAMRVVGANFGVKTIYAVAVASVALYIEQMLITMPGGLLPHEKLLATILGGAFSGLGIGMAFSQGGSTGGTDIIAIIVTKYRNISPGKVILMADVVIISSAFFVLTGTVQERLERLVYGYITMGMTAYTIDTYLSGFKQSLQVFIFSKHFEKIADRVVQDLGRGVTVIEGLGWFSKSPGKIVLVLVRKNELNTLYRMVKEVDTDAFMSVSSAMGVYGKGFEKIRP